MPSPPSDDLSAIPAPFTGKPSSASFATWLAGGMWHDDLMGYTNTTDADGASEDS